LVHGDDDTFAHRDLAVAAPGEALQDGDGEMPFLDSSGQQKWVAHLLVRDFYAVGLPQESRLKF
jgi:hypothetical protein